MLKNKSWHIHVLTSESDSNHLLRRDSLWQWAAHAKHSLADGIPIEPHKRTWLPLSTTQMTDDDGHNRRYRSSGRPRPLPLCQAGVSRSGCTPTNASQKGWRQEDRKYHGQQLNLNHSFSILSLLHLLAAGKERINVPFDVGLHLRVEDMYRIFSNKSPGFLFFQCPTYLCY